MIVAFFVAVTLFIILFFAFFHYSPKGRRGVAAYNISVLILIAGLSGYYVWDLHREMTGTVDYDWFYVVALLAVLGIAIVALALFALLRNYVVFRR